MRIPDLSDIQEQQAQPEGEYDFKVVSAKDVISKNTGREGIRLGIQLVGISAAKMVNESMWLPMDSDDEAKAEVMWRMLKERIRAFDLPDSGCRTEDFIGLEKRGVFKLSQWEDGTEVNELVRIVG